MQRILWYICTRVNGLTELSIEEKCQEKLSSFLTMWKVNLIDIVFFFLLKWMSQKKMRRIARKIKSKSTIFANWCEKWMEIEVEKAMIRDVWENPVKMLKICRISPVSSAPKQFSLCQRIGIGCFVDHCMEFLTARDEN